MILMAQACYRFKNDGVRITSSETKTYKKFSQSQQTFPPSFCNKRRKKEEKKTREEVEEGGKMS